MLQPMRDPLAPPPPADDVALVALVERARAGDHAAFTALFERFNTRICTYLARLVGNEDLGRDLAQDTFLAAWRALPEMRDPPRFTAWLYRIATNAAYSQQRRSRVIRWLPWMQHAERSTGSASIVPGPEEGVGEAERVRLALARLGPQRRTCLLLQVEGGFTQREIAALLGISEKTVSVYVSRGREAFRQAYRSLDDDAQADGKGGHPR